MNNKIILEDSYQRLYNNTVSGFPGTKRKQDSAQVQAQTTMFIPTENGFEARAKTRSDKGTYDSVAFFQDVEYVEEGDPQAVDFVGPDGSDYFILPINQNSNVQVACTCLDFHWRFAVWNGKHNSLYGDAPDPYVKKTDRPSQNPRHLPGVCKHLMKLFDVLKQERLVK